MVLQPPDVTGPDHLRFILLQETPSKPAQTCLYRLHEPHLSPKSFLPRRFHALKLDCIHFTYPGPSSILELRAV